MKNNYDDPMFDEVVAFVVETGKASASSLHNHFRFGYNRSFRLIDLLETRGIIGPYKGSKPRDVLITSEDLSTFHNINQVYVDSLKNEMFSYGINIEDNYGKVDVVSGIKNSVITNVDSDKLKRNIIDYFLKYMPYNQLKLVLINYTKNVFLKYKNIPNLFSPITSAIEYSESIINNLYSVMEERLNLFVKSNVKSYKQYCEIQQIPYILLVIDEVSICKTNKKIYDLLIKIILNGETVGIKVILFSKYSILDLNLDKMVDMLEVYDKFDMNKFIGN